MIPVLAIGARRFFHPVICSIPFRFVPTERELLMVEWQFFMWDLANICGEYLLEEDDEPFTATITGHW